MLVKRRRRLFVDRRVQGMLMARVTAYWCLCLAAVACARYLFCLFPLDTSNSSVVAYEVADELGPTLLASLVLLPAAIVDALRWSHRFAGPACRLRRGLTELAMSDQPTEPIQLRGNDYWQETADAFNRVASQVDDVHACDATQEDMASQVLPLAASELQYDSTYAGSC